MSGQKHVLIIGKYYPPVFGGVERYAADVARTAARKYRVTVLVHNTGPEDAVERDGNITIIRCGTMRIVNAQPISPTMWGHIWRLKPDLIQFNAPNFWAAAMLCILHRKCPIVITHHADVFGRPFIKRLVMPFYRHLVRRSTHLLVNSIKNANISPDLPKNIPSILEVPWGVDAGLYQPQAANDQIHIARRADRFGNAIVVGFVGRFVRYKGLSVLISALSRMDNAHALLIGDGPLRPQIETEIKAAGLSQRVHMIGNVDDRRKVEEMLFMDVLAFPSLETTEAFGAVQVEAQLLRIPIVASDLPTGVTDITINDLTGLLVPPGDSGRLAEALTKICNDAQLAKRYGDAGRERALRKFTLEKFEWRIAELLDSCLVESNAQSTSGPA